MVHASIRTRRGIYRTLSDGKRESVSGRLAGPAIDVQALRLATGLDAGRRPDPVLLVSNGHRTVGVTTAMFRFWHAETSDHSLGPVNDPARAAGAMKEWLAANS
jgi:hypothetical protein